MPSLSRRHFLECSALCAGSVLLPSARGAPQGNPSAPVDPGASGVMRWPAVSGNPLRTRSDLQCLARDLWTPTANAFRANGPRALLGGQRARYGAQIEHVETFARVLWGLGPLLSGKGGADLVDAADIVLMRSILVRGVTPGTEDYWGDPLEGSYDQRYVEMPPIALTLVWVRSRFWEPLSEAERTRVARWLGLINKASLPNSNWRWFRVLTNACLRVLGQPHDAAREAEDLAVIESLWFAPGYYGDGSPAGIDYYAPWALHFYGSIYARLIEDREPVRAATLRRRAQTFAPQFVAWFAADGAALPIGRSLHYRFAQSAFWAGLAWAGEDAGLSWGVIKGLLLRNLRWWMRRPIFSGSGRLTLGYGYRQPHMVENYASSASPYWALKPLLVLALDETHPFWTSEEAPLPPQPPTQSQPSGSPMIILRAEGDGGACALAASQIRSEWLRHLDSKYHKFAYSSAFAFSVPQSARTLPLLAPDNMLALCDAGDDAMNRQWRVREGNEVVRLEDGGARLYARWRPWSDVLVETWLEPPPHPAGRGTAHVRTHRITTGRALKTFEGGFAVERPDPDKSARTGAAGRAALKTATAFSAITDSDGVRTGTVLETEPHTHLLWPLALLPGLEGDLSPGTHTLRCLVRAATG